MVCFCDPEFGRPLPFCLFFFFLRGASNSSLRLTNHPCKAEFSSHFLFSMASLCYMLQAAALRRVPSFVPSVKKTSSRNWIVWEKSWRCTLVECTGGRPTAGFLPEGLYFGEEKRKHKSLALSLYGPCPMISQSGMRGLHRASFFFISCSWWCSCCVGVDHRT